MSKIDEKYHNLLQHILNEGFTYEDSNRKGVNRIQIPSWTINHDFKDGFPALTTKKLYWKGVVGELLWFLRGDTNIKYLVDNGINIWNKDAYNYYKTLGGSQDFKNFLISCTDDIPHPSRGNLGRVYGAQWRKFNGVDHCDLNEDGFTSKYVDQISNLIKGLKENPMGTRHIVTAWNPAELDNMALPPCHWSFEILVEPLKIGSRVKYIESKDFEKKLRIHLDNFDNEPEHLKTAIGFREDYCDKQSIPKYQFTLKWHQRSVDTFLGLPFNIASYALLAQIIGRMTNMVPKGIIGDLSNVHIYESHLKAVKEQLSRDTNRYGSPITGITADKSFSVKDPNLNINDFINNLKIDNFKLLDYKSYPAIPAEMLSYDV